MQLALNEILGEIDGLGDDSAHFDFPAEEREQELSARVAPALVLDEVPIAQLDLLDFDEAGFVRQERKELLLDVINADHAHFAEKNDDIPELGRLDDVAHFDIDFLDFLQARNRENQNLVFGLLGQQDVLLLDHENDAQLREVLPKVPDQVLELGRALGGLHFERGHVSRDRERAFAQRHPEQGFALVNIVPGGFWVAVDLVFVRIRRTRVYRVF